MKISDIFRIISQKKIQFIDFKFTDLPGTWNHISIPVKHLEASTFSDGISFDGSSIRGFQLINESDMLLKPDPETAFIDPFCDTPTLSFVCNVVNPVGMIDYSRDPRNIAQKAENYLKKSGVGDTVFFGPEAEFYIFDEIAYDQTSNQSFHFIDSAEGAWNTGKRHLEESKNLGYKIPHKRGYFPVSPSDNYQNLRTKMVEVLQDIGIDVELHHHEVGTAGQSEIGIRFGELKKQADILMKYKYVIKNTAKRYNKTVTFMPKPLFMDNGNGMHTHVSIWKEGQNLFFGRGRYGDLSQLAEYFIGGLIKHSGAVLAFTNPSTNSYRRLVPGYEAPILLTYSSRNRSAAIRVPLQGDDEKSKRIEFRCPDPSCNPYLAFSAILMAGLDGILNGIEPPEPLDKDLYTLPAEKTAAIKSTPSDLAESIRELEKDHDFLLKGGVFTSDMIEMWIDYKMKHEIDSIRLRPHPHEFALYYDI